MTTLVSQLTSRLQETETEAMEKASEIEKKLIQTTKEVELLKVENSKFMLTFFSYRNTDCAKQSDGSRNIRANISNMNPHRVT